MRCGLLNYHLFQCGIFIGVCFSLWKTLLLLLFLQISFCNLHLLPIGIGTTLKWTFSVWWWASSLSFEPSKMFGWMWMNAKLTVGGKRHLLCNIFACSTVQLVLMGDDDYCFHLPALSSHPRFLNFQSVLKLKSNTYYHPSHSFDNATPSNIYFCKALSVARVFPKCPGL